MYASYWNLSPSNVIFLKKNTAVVKGIILCAIRSQIVRLSLELYDTQCTYHIAGKFGGELNLAVWWSARATAKLKSAKISYSHICMAIPYWTAKFKSTNMFAMAIWEPTAKFNSRQYFRLYGIHHKYRCTWLYFRCLSRYSSLCVCWRGFPRQRPAIAWWPTSSSQTWLASPIHQSHSYSCHSHLQSHHLYMVSV